MTVPKPFWAVAISTTCLLINRMPSVVLNGHIPFLVLCPEKPLYPIPPKIFGSTCFVHDTHSHLTKLDPESVKCLFVDYCRVQKGYRCFLQIFNDTLFLGMLPSMKTSFSSLYQIHIQ
ncbi:putative RNA-directed DNA polymerase [Helianthus annuus]|uniref:RNA-directed DNA polymerase n=1 Tax=Helianthus annuus TaxID=4232 RepID=A0A9K3GUS2_HELAN|nr:putative RNA-directed DNA polymerase [Helianthus annuus]KAJ0813685.1 putative RNA-directed DNA polymerase [Helianthus annuus]